MTTEEKLIAPYVVDLSANQYSITTPLGEWFQSYETTIAFKGEFGVLIDKDWYEGERTVTTSKYLGMWLNPHIEGRRMNAIHQKVKSGEYKLVPLANYQHPTPNTQHPTVK